MIILASQSPRRVELLSQLGIEFSQQPADIDETVLDNECPTDYVMRVAEEKGRVIAATQSPSVWVLSADTTVVIDDTILGKPANFKEARGMLTLLSGRKHLVHTAVCLTNGIEFMCELVTTEVDFKALSEEEIAFYWSTGEPQDKAGSYGLQGIGGQFVKAIQGSYSSVVGLPKYETAQLLKKANLLKLR